MNELENIDCTLIEVSDWQKLRDAKVHEAREKAGTRLSQLDEKINRLNYEKGDLENTIANLPNNEASVRIHLLQSRRWLLLFFLTIGICIGSAWWTVDWFMTLTWERTLLAVTLFVLPVIGWMVFLTVMEYEAEHWNLRKLFAGLSLLIILSSFTAIGCLGTARMQGVALKEKVMEERVGESAGEFEQNAGDRAEEIIRTKALLNRLAMIAVIFLSLASETAAGIAYHQFWHHRLRVRVSAPYRRKYRKVLNELSVTREQYAKTEKYPDTLHATLTKKGIQHDQRRGSFLPMLRWVAIGFLIFMGLLIFTSLSHGTTVAMVDLSKSTPQWVYAKQLENVTLLIREVKGVQMRILVFGINEQGFSGEPLLDTTSPDSVGRFNEYLEGWQVRTVGQWESTMADYHPTASKSDILGSLLRIGIEYEDKPRAGLNQIYIYSDMRQVGQGLNFEKQIGEPEVILPQLKNKGLIPDLSGIEVWILGVRTSGITEKRWFEIRAFWRSYFDQAGATLRLYTPTHDLR